MLYRVIPVLSVALGLFLIGTDFSSAEDKVKTHEGVIVKAGNNQLVMTDKDGKNEHTHKVGKEASISCENKKCTLEDLKAGDTVRVTVGKENDSDVATKIEAKKKT